MFSVDLFTTIINRLLPEPHAGLLIGMLFGGSSTLPPELVDALIATGTLHIIALSGTNITILTAMTRSVLIYLVPANISMVLMIPLITGFVFFVGPSPSIIRAAIMGIISIAGQLTGRRIAGLVSWNIAVLFMIVMDPSIMMNLSFQLSASASLGIVLFDRVGSSHWFEAPTTFREGVRQSMRRVWSGAVAGLRTTLAAQVCTIPIVFMVFHRMSLISPLTNLLIAWVIPWIMGLGIVMTIVGLMYIPMAYPFSWIVYMILTYLMTVVEITSRIPFASVGR